MATRIAARELQDASKAANRSSGSASEAGLAAERKQDYSWYQFDKTLMTEILTRERAYDPNSATMKQKGEATPGRVQPNGGVDRCTIAEILHFSDLHSKMQSSRTPEAQQKPQQ
jgi:hypothetical protein